ncbi:MAG: SRPBCC domain-containing protein [Actinomycetota bacterium]|nr:SRPBCC domain-containing protein [Actinomycetota bacterium]
MSEHLIESVTVEIEAPQQLVWDVLTDYARYPAWNPYTVRVETTLEIGSVIDLHLPDPANPGTTFVNSEYVRAVDAPHYLRYDTAEEIPGMLAVREQWVTDLGGGRSSYRTTDLFSGEIAAFVHEQTGAWVKAGFDEVAHALKARAESLAGFS